MSKHIVILYTVINTPIDLHHIFQVISTFSGISEWSVDLDDCDKILRVVCNDDIGKELVKRLKTVGVSSSVTEVFDENGVSIM